MRASLAALFAMLGLVGLVGLLGLLGLLGTQPAGAAGAAKGDPFLEADQAFRGSALVLDGRTLALRWAIAPGYHLYRERFSVADDGPASPWAAPQVPAGRLVHDPNLDEDLHYWEGQPQVRLPLTPPAAGTPRQRDLTVRYQGCADAGLCYPPQEMRVRVTLDAQGQIAKADWLGEVDASGGASAPASANGAAAATTAATTAANTAATPAAATTAAAAGAAATPAVVNSAPATAQATGSAAALAASAGATQLAAAPAGGAAIAPAAATPAREGDGDGATRALRSGSLLAVAGVFLLAGLLLSLTPCVLPMVPILSSIIVGHGTSVSRGKGFALALAYSLGMALVYTLFGVAAGLAGEGLAAALQNPWVLGSFALLLVVLAASMFGLYELQLPAVLQTRLTAASGALPGGRIGGVFLMGGVSALVVGPCVAAPLAGALVYISQTRDVLLGGLALFCLAMGMSVPLLLVGASASALLPRTGRWMASVKTVFGVLLLAVALWLVSPVLPTAATMALLGGLLLTSALLMGEAAGKGHTLRPFGRAGALLLGLAGMAQVIGALSGGDSLLQPLRHLARGAGLGGDAVLASASAGTAGAARGAARAEAAGPVFERIRTVAELDARVQQAGVPVMLDIAADWCVSCKELDAITFADPAVRSRLAKAVLLRADVTANTADDKALMRRFGLFGPPGVLLFDRQGREQPAARVIGYQPPQQFLQRLQQVGL